MESSRRDFLIDVVDDMFIFKNDHITLSPCLHFTPKIGGAGIPNTGV